MNINFPKDFFKNIPKIAWILIALGIFALCVGGGIALAKFGVVTIRREKIEQSKQ